MSLLVAIEGGDGAGKATAAANVASLIRAAGLNSIVLSFPRYSETVGGYFLGEYLAGRLPREASPKATAVLYALDRLESRDCIIKATLENDVVILDRYVASNIAYQAAKSNECEVAALIDWITRLEIDMFELPTPDLSIYLDTPLKFARELILLKQTRSYTDRQYDEYERDVHLQERVRQNYTVLANESRLGPWLTVSTVNELSMRPPEDIAREIADALLERLCERTT